MKFEEFEEMMKKYKNKKIRLTKWPKGQFLIPTYFRWSRDKKKCELGGKLGNQFVKYPAFQKWKIIDYAHSQSERIRNGSLYGYTKDELGRFYSE